MTCREGSAGSGALNLLQLRFRKKLAQAAAQLGFVFGLAQGGEACEHFAHTVRRMDGDLADEDFRMAGLRQALFIDFKFLEELFAGPYAGEDDVYVFMRSQPGKRDEVFG